MAAPDYAAYTRKIAVEMASGAAPGAAGLEDKVSKAAAFFQDRMLDRGFTVGSNAVTAPLIERTFMDFLLLLNAHLEAGSITTGVTAGATTGAGAGRPYVLGRSPCMADFGLAGQLYQVGSAAMHPASLYLVSRVGTSRLPALPVSRGAATHAACYACCHHHTAAAPPTPSTPWQRVSPRAPRV